MRHRWRLRPGGEQPDPATGSQLAGPLYAVRRTRRECGGDAFRGRCYDLTRKTGSDEQWLMYEVDHDGVLPAAAAARDLVRVALSQTNHDWHRHG